MSRRERKTPKNDSNKGSRSDFKRKQLEKIAAKKMKRALRKAEFNKNKNKAKRKNGPKPSTQLVVKLRTAKILGQKN